jgi:Ca2+-binding EF-hand superfamily protein
VPAPPPPAIVPLTGGHIFISPMGEPFHGEDGVSGAEEWFRKTDANHDNHITPQEFTADAMRFFATLDTDHDGQIGPDEIEHYETDVAPEIRVMSTYGDASLAKTDDDGTVTPPPYPTRLGAGRYGFLDMPEPVVSADANFDRAISRQEFAAAAVKRFQMLDSNGDGLLTREDLPKLDTRVAKQRRGGGGGGGSGNGGSGGHHRGGGMGGGGMGGGGMGGGGMGGGGMGGGMGGGVIN